MRIKRLIVLIAALFLWIPAAKAATSVDTSVMEDIVVTASRSEQTSDQAPAATSVITKEEIEKFNIETLDEALKFETNAYHRNGMGILMTSKPINLRGIPGSQRTLILLNGIPMNSGFNGAVNWNNISMGNVERIEIIRGSGSSLYGGNAMGGIINIITRDPDEFEATVTLGVGEQSTYKTAVSVGTKKDRFSFLLGGELQDTDGYAPYLRHRPIKDGDGDLSGGWYSPSNTGSDYWVIGDRGDMSASNKNLNFMASYDTSDTGEVRFEIQTGLHESEYGLPHTYIVDADGNPVWSGDIDAGDGEKVPIKYSDFLYGSRKLEQSFFMPSLTYKESFGSLDFKGTVSYKKLNNVFGEEDASGEDTYENAPGTLFDRELDTFTTDLQVGFEAGTRHYFTMGAYYRYDDLKRDTYGLTYYRDLDAKEDHEFIIRGEETQYALFVQDQWEIFEAVTLYTGLRWDSWEAHDGQSGNVGAVVDIEDYEEHHLSPKLSAVWQVGENTFVRGSVANSFRGPTISELFYLPSSSYVANPDLKPETMWNYEIGADQYLMGRKVKLSGAVFHSDIEDMISRRKVDGVRFYDNFSEAEVDGVELSAWADMTDWLRVWGNISYNRTKITEDQTEPDVEGNWLPGVPKLIGNIGFDAVFSPVKLSLGGNFLGREYTGSENDDEEDLRGGYAERWLWNAKLSYSPKEWVEASISVNNIFDTQDYEWVYMERGRFVMAEVAFNW